MAGVAGVIGDMDRPVLLGFLGRLFGEVPRDGVIRRAALHQVHRNRRKLQRGPALQEENLMRLRHPKEAAQLRLGVREDFGEYRAAVAHLHDGHAAAVIVHDLRFCPLQDLLRKDGRTGGKIIYSVFCHDASPDLFFLTFLREIIYELMRAVKCRSAQKSCFSAAVLDRNVISFAVSGRGQHSSPA